jgi:hypothetical protein
MHAPGIFVAQSFQYSCTTCKTTLRALGFSHFYPKSTVSTEDCRHADLTGFSVQNFNHLPSINHRESNFSAKIILSTKIIAIQYLIKANLLII